MSPLRKIAMMLALYDIVIESQWISTKDNWLADILSRGVKREPRSDGQLLDLCYSRSSANCAVKSVRHLMEKFRFPGNSPLFRLQNSTFTRQFVINALRTSLARLGVEGNCSGHSFRRGAATSAKEVGLSDAEIQLLGRWKSNSYRLYIDLGFDKLWNISWRHLR